ncbi:hypothetical protein JL101_000055 [Skermanella rosea]|uniref:hypothetical protein n=1 Tax=Skermanella rosea TaxID=1817965 RepID=UPI0019324B42|nr:hypothetical protein [Skermanella rosea]UEM03877.1 hypothetical protein JL101_000055 [Skermanella rosea]
MEVTLGLADQVGAELLPLRLVVQVNVRVHFDDEHGIVVLDQIHQCVRGSIQMQVHHLTLDEHVVTSAIHAGAVKAIRDGNTRLDQVDQQFQIGLLARGKGHRDIEMVTDDADDLRLRFDVPQGEAGGPRNFN